MDTASTGPLWVPHPDALNVVYANLESFALGERLAFVGTAGSVVERRNADGVRFYAHQFYDGSRRQRERYVAGPVGQAEAEAKAQELRTRIERVKAQVPLLRMLGREGFAMVPVRAYAAIAALHNRGVFAAGGMLIGSHAYGVILNRMGVRVAPYMTEDVDLARGGRLAFERAPEIGLREILTESGIEFLEVPSLDRKAPATKFRERGKGTLEVDLLVPSRDETFRTVPVPELRAHATGLPYLGYLLAESQPGTVIMREGCCAVRVPLPERFAIHKLVVSRLRAGRSAKAGKDVGQAVVLLAALGDAHGGAIADAVAALPKRASKHFRRAREEVRPVLEARAPRAWAELAG